MIYTWSSCGYAGLMVPGNEDREMPEDIAKRTPPPDDVFCLPLVDSWRDRIWRMLEDLITAEVKDAFVGDPPEYVVSDDLSWLDEIMYEVTGRIVNMKELVTDRFANEYRAFRAGHGTRPRGQRLTG